MMRKNEKKTIFKKARRSRAGNEIAETNQNIILPQRVFLYLHPKSVTFSDGLFALKSEIEVEHQFSTITNLNDHYMPRNIIQVEQLDIVKPTFSVTVVQDSLEDISTLADYPILLTLYVYTQKTSQISEFSETIATEEQNYEEIRTPVAQGHIDIVEYFNKKRINGFHTVFLYPLKNNGQPLTCKTEWEIYSLHPLLRNITISNYLFLTFDSLYNINQDLMDNSKNLMANLSFISKIPDEKNDYDKIFICNFKMFTKSIIAEQNLTKKWESLRSNILENDNCLGIASECKIILNQLFMNLLCTENVEFNLNRINKNEDFALICNSIHRYVLTDNTQKILERILSISLYQILVEICMQEDESKVLLQGYIDLSIFMYPKVNNCSFAVELKPPVFQKLKNQNANKGTLKNGKPKRKSKLSQDQQETKENKIPFAIVQICLHSSVTSTCQEINAISDQTPKHNKFCQYPVMLPKNIQFSLRSNCDYNYKDFDDLILEIMDFIVHNNIKTLNDNKEFFRNQQSNINNKIIKLLACDFNIRTPTKTNIEFTNLITTVYGDLIGRIYNYINKCSLKSLKNCVFTVIEVQHFIIKNMSLAKCLYEVGNKEMANVFMKLLHAEYSNNTMLKFYMFLYDIERQNFDMVREYLKTSLDDKDTEGELFAGLIQIYVNFKLQLQDPECNETVQEDLLKALSDYSEGQNPMPLTGFVLLYCVYKRHNYEPGMAYCRWRYENLFDSKFIKLEIIPKSRWEIYMPHKINLKSLKGQNFTKVCNNLLRLGLYTFAQWVFNEIADECLEIERYFFSSTFIILDNRLKENIQIKDFSLDKFESSLQLRSTLSLVNGNLEYFRLPKSTEYIKHYKSIGDLEEKETHDYYQLGLLRYAYEEMKEQNYKEASQVFLKLCNDNITCVVALIGRGIACYHLDQLDEAEKYFALSTEHGVYMENVWAYLAIINLEKGNTYNALECWKYARLNRNAKIHKTILDELKKINYSDIDLFVDVPSKIRICD